MALLKSEQDKLDKIYKSWEDPVEFVYHAIGIKNRMEEFPNDDITKQQKEYLKKLGQLVRAKIKAASGKPMNALEKSLSTKIGISIRAGQGPGKTTAISWAIIWFLCMFENSTIPCFAPKASQLSDNLWKEVGLWLDIMDQYGSPLVKGKLVLQQDKIYHKDHKKSKAEWAAIAKTVKDTANKQEQGASARGSHGDFMMVAIDEASAVKEGVFEVIEGTTNGPCNFVIMIANPIKTSGYFYDSHNKNSKDWIAMHWDNRDCERIPKEVIRRMENSHGPESNYFRINVLGEFPREEADVFIPYYLIEDAFNADLLPAEDDPLSVGVDPAGFGKDRTVICERKGPCVGPIWTYQNQDTMQTANWLAMYNTENKPSSVCIDSNGIGAGVYDRCNELGMPAYAINSSKLARNTERYHLVRDELLWGIRDAFFEGRVSINLQHPNVTEERVKQLEKELKEEIASIRVLPYAKGRIKFEPKSEMKKRLGRSPDLLDALCLSMYWHDDVFRETKRKTYDFDGIDDDVGDWMGA